MSDATAVAFVAGATGYTGREVVAALCRRGVRTVAHLRPGSAAAPVWRERFRALGAEVDETPWESSAMRAILTRLRPTHIFALLGTTRARAAREGLSDAYEQVDYGLTSMLVRAAQDAVALGAPAHVTYLSALGVTEGTRNPYLAARVKVERELRDSGLPHLIVRPALVTGPDRDELRVVERVAGVASDALLGLLGLFGARTLRDKWSSLSGKELGDGMVALALGESERAGVADPAAIRRALREH